MDKTVPAGAYPNKLIAQIGIMSARYMSPVEISVALGGKVTPAQVEAAWRQFGFAPPVLAPGHELIDVSLSAKHRTKLAAEARLRGPELPSLCGLVLAIVARDGLFAAVLDA